MRRDQAAGEVRGKNAVLREGLDHGLLPDVDIQVLVESDHDADEPLVAAAACATRVLRVHRMQQAQHIVRCDAAEPDVRNLLRLRQQLLGHCQLRDWRSTWVVTVLDLREVFVEEVLGGCVEVLFLLVLVQPQLRVGELGVLLALGR